ncbi:MAG: MBL fold metallo-hydrolase [Candidatus Bathyarchaeota archaeon]|nr:MAG: MBL fold metallo-hydrolase [Candidatus Bathyarchaeota archaeon]
MKITPLAFESMGVRSMCTHVRTDDINLVIDPAVSLAPSRFGLPPHKVEEEAKEGLWRRAKKAVADADVIIVTHYHFDHVDPKEPEIYRGKRVLLKHPRRMINPSQKARAASFIRSIKGLAQEIEYADNRSFTYGDTMLRFSKPVPHGSDATRGYVVEVCVESGERFVHTSDVQGPVLDEQAAFIMAQRPGVLFVDGPSTYLVSPMAEIELRRANEYLLGIMRDAEVDRLVIDHHLARDIDYRERIRPIIAAGEELGVSIQVAAEFLDVEANLLEAMRPALYERDG